MFHQEAASVGDLRRAKVTLPQAAHILELGVAQVRKAVDRHVVAPGYAVQGRRRIRTLDGVDVLCLRVRGALKAPIVTRLYLRLKHAPDRESLKTACDISFDDVQGRSSKSPIAWIYDAAAETLADIASLEDLSRLIDADGTIRGAGVEAHRIAALVAGGMSVDEVLADYPTLDRTQVDAAVRYAQGKPKQGRPYPSRTAKSVLGQGGGGGLSAAFAAARHDEEGREEGGEQGRNGG